MKCSGVPAGPGRPAAGLGKLYAWWSMPTASEVQQRIEAAIPGSVATVEDLTGGGDHFRAVVVADAFRGLSRIQQHKLVYDVFGAEIGGPIHALSLRTHSE
jgi:stress-induced morphogen